MNRINRLQHGKLRFIVAVWCLTGYALTSAHEGHRLATSIDIAMPSVTPKQDDDYLCTAKNISAYGTKYIHKFEPNSNADRAHHMLLFACDFVPDYLTQGEGWWNCGHHSQACQRIIYAWAKNAPATVLPDNVGLRVGPEAGLGFIVLQVHYAHALPEGTKDTSGFTLRVSSEEPEYLAGMMILFRYSLTIPPQQEKTHGDINCPLSTTRPIHPFAFRVHTHKLGSVVSGYVYNQTTGYRIIGKGNPQWPQAFYPIKGKPLTVNPGEILAARCTYNTIGHEETTYIGSTAGDEMCNLYLMYYTDSRDPQEHSLDCPQEYSLGMNKMLPEGNDVPLPRNETLEEHAKGSHHHTGASPGPVETKRKNHAKKRPGTDFMSPMPDADYTDALDGAVDRDRTAFQRKLPDNVYQYVSNWPQSLDLGQVTGVDLDKEGNVVVFHRADRVWGANTFNEKNEFAQKELGPIQADTVYVLHPTSGKILHQWGKNLFYLPHDITVGPKGDTFLTDVALHQVFKYSPGSTTPSLVLGTRFEPGSDDSHFCKPAAVAETTTGDIFVADGYCNYRIIKFDSKGKKLMEIGRKWVPYLFQSFLRQTPPAYSFNIPHALALAEKENLICVADRENGRIQCFTPKDLQHAFTIESRDLSGTAVYSVAYSAVDGGSLFAVTQSSQMTPSSGLVISLQTRRVVATFQPTGSKFGLPHDVAVSSDGSSIYVTEISRPYRVLKFSKSNHRSGKGDSGPPGITQPVLSGPKDPERRIDPVKKPVLESGAVDSSSVDQDSVIIMAFLTIPLLALVGIGALFRLRSRGCCKKTRETKSFAEFFPPSAGFEKLRMDESESDNSDAEIEEFTVPSYRKAHA